MKKLNEGPCRTGQQEGGAIKRLAFEQQPRESIKAYAAFKVYLDMGAQRSLIATAAKLGKCRRLIERWSRRFEWSGRVQAYSDWMAVVERKAAESSAARYGADRAKRRELEREDEWVLRTDLMEAGRAVLKRFKDGSRGATLGDVARALDIATKLGRLSTGMKVNDSEEEKGGTDVNVLVAIELALDKIYGEEPGAKAEVIDVETVEPKESQP